MDTNKVDLKKIWMNQKVNQGNLYELFMKIELLKKSNRKNNIVTSLILLLTSAILSGIWFLFQPKLMATKVGFVLIILAILFLIFTLNKDLFNFSKESENENNASKDYLNYLMKLKEKQIKMQTSVLNAYLIFLYTGVLLVMYEFAFEMSLFWSILTYIITISWLLLVWLYLRPRLIKKQNTHIENIINKLYILQTQFEME